MGKKRFFIAVFLWISSVLAAYAEVSMLPADAPKNQKVKTNPKLLQLEPNKWFKLYENPKDKEALNIKHCGAFSACYDSKRGRIVILGCETRGNGVFLANSPFFFDPVECKWTRAYPDDPIETYRANDEGIHVAGEKGNHPFASVMNASIVYDSDRDELVLCHYDGHVGENPKCPNLDFSKSIPATNGGQPFWGMNLETLEWKPFLAGKNPNVWRLVFHPSVYDAARKTIVSVWTRGVCEIGPSREAMERTFVANIPVGTYWNAVLDSKHNAVVCYAGYPDGGIWVYEIASKKAAAKPTPGVKPPEGAKCPMAFDPGIGKTVVVAGTTSGKEPQTQTWLYDLGADAWKRLPDADLVFKDGLNAMNMIYDSRHKVCLLVAYQYQGYHSVWALKIDEAKLGGESKPTP